MRKCNIIYTVKRAILRELHLKNIYPKLYAALSDCKLVYNAI